MSKTFLSPFTEQDRRFMQRALELAQKGIDTTKPNPMVGAVLVNNNKIIREAYHHKAGQAHAEVLALRGINKGQLRDATLYLTLEPCCHSNKKTPPCADFLLKSGLRSLVVATKDLNPAVNGKGIAFLRKGGMKVCSGLLSEEAEQLNEVFFKNILTSFPFIVLKSALTLDGKIATMSGDSRWITNEKSRKYVHTLRSHYDAVITSSITVMHDNPHLGVRKTKGTDPFRIIIDRKLVTDPKALVYRDSNVMVATTSRASKKRRELFQNTGIALKIYSENFRLSVLLKDLREMGITSVMIEAGGLLSSAFIREKMIDKYLFFLAPKIIGGDGKNGIGSIGVKKIKDVITFKKIHWRSFENDILVEAYPPK